MVTTFLPRGAELVLPTVLGQLPELVGGGGQERNGEGGAIVGPAGCYVFIGVRKTSGAKLPGFT